MLLVALVAERIMTSNMIWLDTTESYEYASTKATEVDESHWLGWSAHGLALSLLI